MAVEDLALRYSLFFKECEAGGKPWIDKNIKKLKSHLKYIQNSPKLKTKHSEMELQKVEENLNLQLDDSL